ncbi:MAG: glycosyltransferase family 4 protein [Planctomycetia bacterium]|nr:glycosyltransferase family 4 protein [Planctomycetia bacterium]
MTRRVAILCEFGTLNGGEHSLLAVLPRLIACGWTPTVFGPASGALMATLRARDIAVEPIEYRASDGGARPRNLLREEIADRLRSLEPSLLHANSLSMGRLSGPVAEALALPSIAHLRDIVGLSKAAVGDLNRHRRLLAVSAATREAHVRQGLIPERTCVLYNGVDVTEFQPSEPNGWLQRELGLPHDAQLIGCVGQLILRKGQHVLADAAAMLADRWPTLQYVFVGTRHSEKEETRRFEENLRSTFSSGALASRGHFLGVRTDVPSLLRELTLLAHPARQEPFGRVLLEAGASGCAIVATDVGGTREIFAPDSEAAVLIAPDDPRGLAEAIEELLLHPERRAELGQRARRRIVDAFGAERSAEGLLRHYNEVSDANGTVACLA